MAEDHREAALALAAFCQHERDACELSAFYASVGFKDVVQTAKVVGVQKGVRSFVSLHDDLLTCRTEGSRLLVSALGTDQDLNDPVSRLTSRLSRLRLTDPDGNHLSEIERALTPLRENESSMTKFAQKVKSMGLCLTNGQIYGENLKQRLRNDAGLRVNKAKAKQFPLVKKCLVLV